MIKSSSGAVCQQTSAVCAKVHGGVPQLNAQPQL